MTDALDCRLDVILFPYRYTAGTDNYIGIGRGGTEGIGADDANMICRQFL